MCWTSKTKPLVKTAEENIPIFKICRSDYSKTVDEVYSFYREFTYKLNKEYTHKGSTLHPIKSVLYDEYVIDIGFHSYSADITDVHIRKNLIGDNVIWINLLTYPSYVTYRMYNIFIKNRVIRVNGYIPRGASYVINNNGECVSDKIVLTDIQTIK